jgi:phosphoribosylformimino-5-aminoimidazole carboxamide ribotide isomerase
MRFRPCIDLRNGKVVQIVGGSLDDSEQQVVTNFESEQSPADYALRYQQDRLTGGHVIALGPGSTSGFTGISRWPANGRRDQPQQCSRVS